MNIAIVGATGKVGREMLSILHDAGFPSQNIYLFASKRTQGRPIAYGEQTITVDALTASSFENVDVSLFSAGSEVSKIYAPIAKDAGVSVIDNSSQWRMDKDVPLIVPEINPHTFKLGHINANPNCSTIQSVVPLQVIDSLFDVTRVEYVTYQAVSGSGQAGEDELSRTLNGEAAKNYTHPIAHNVIAGIDKWVENGYTKEEQKMIEETRKIMDKDVAVSATCARVPVYNGHGVSLSVRTQASVDLDALIKAFESHASLTYHDYHEIVTPRDISGSDSIHISRLRKDQFDDTIIHCFVLADNIRKGAALNAVQIMQLMEAL